MKSIKDKFNDLIKNKSIFFIVIIIACLFLGIGYAEITGIDLEVSGLAKSEVEKDIIITDVSYLSDNGALVSESIINDTYLTLMNSTIALGDSTDSTITYQITIKNNGDYPGSYKEAIFSSDIGYDNDDIEFILQGISEGDILNADEEIQFTITFKYKDTVTTVTNNVLNSYINFKFDVIDKVARIGNNYYDTLKKAFNAVPKDNTSTTIDLLQDTSEATTIDENQYIILNLHNHTVSNNDNNPVIINNGTLFLSDGTIYQDASTNGALNNMGTGTMFISNTRVEVTGGRQALYNNGGFAEISGNSYLSSAATERAAVHNLANGTMNIKSATIISTGSHAVTNTGTMTIGEKDGDVDVSSPTIQGYADGVNITDNKKINFYNGTIKGRTGAISSLNLVNDVEDTYDVAYSEEIINNVKYIINYLAHANTVTFNPTGGSISEPIRNIETGHRICTLPEPTKPGYEFAGWFTASTGGNQINPNTIINNDITYFAHWVEASEAEINGEKYDTVQLAINAVPTDGTPITIDLLKDTASNLTTSSGQNITLNLCGYTISNANATPVFENYASLTIKNGSLFTDGTQSIVNNNPGSSLVIDSVNVTATGTKQALYNFGGATLTIKGDSYITSKTNGKPSGSTMERGTVQNLSGGTMYILGGTIVGEKQQAVSNEGTLTIGTKDGNVSQTSPVLRGLVNGIKSTGTLNFYDGIAEGVTAAINGTVTDCETQIVEGTEVISGKTYKTKYNN